MIPVYVASPDKSKALKINGEGEITVSIHTHPPLDEKIQSYPLSEFFVDENGSNDLRVDGSSTPQVFSISAVADYDIFIKTISVKISDNGSRLDRFAALDALTNGMSFEYSSPEVGSIVISDEIKTNLDFIRVGLASPAFGTGSDVFKADLSGSGDDTYLPVIDMNQTFGFTWGLRLRKGTTAMLKFVVNDDLSSGIGDFNIKGFGIKV